MKSLKVLAALLVFITSCNIGSNEPKCYYIPSERVLFIDNSHYKIKTLCINVYSHENFEGDFEQYKIHFKKDLNLYTVDLDNIDTSMIIDSDISVVNKIVSAKNTLIPFIYINNVFDEAPIDDIRSLTNIDLSKPITECNKARIW
ncbi:MAG: hypothetical protein CVU11_08775 [Bacteroidetes bacterium HGW-Bacteroidetes-6]|jgi:hypothetical protein|nr:MAG: hypothetical protein CVU11_08775 [Bacteroidetes bacterium HGW-Bacteroidetes-6]